MKCAPNIWVNLWHIQIYPNVKNVVSEIFDYDYRRTYNLGVSNLMYCRYLFSVDEIEKKRQVLGKWDGKIDLTYKVFATDIASLIDVIIYFIPFRCGKLNAQVKKVNSRPLMTRFTSLSC